MEKILTFMNYWLGKLYIPCGIPADKQMHFLSGAILGVVLFLLTGSFSISFVSVSLVAMFKEVYDLLHRNKHTPDVWDWVATTLGGLFGGLLTKLVLFSL